MYAGHRLLDGLVHSRGIGVIRKSVYFKKKYSRLINGIKTRVRR
jgi:hypothetical protein